MRFLLFALCLTYFSPSVQAIDNPKKQKKVEACASHRSPVCAKAQSMAQTCKTNVADGDMLIDVDIEVDSNGVATKLSPQIKGYNYLVKGNWKLVACPLPNGSDKCLKESKTEKFLYTTCK